MPYVGGMLRALHGWAGSRVAAFAVALGLAGAAPMLARPVAAGVHACRCPKGAHDCHCTHCRDEARGRVAEAGALEAARHAPPCHRATAGVALRPATDHRRPASDRSVPCLDAGCGDPDLAILRLPAHEVFLLPAALPPAQDPLAQALHGRVGRGLRAVLPPPALPPRALPASAA